MIDEEVTKGHMLGPFTEPPFPNMVFSPINLVPKCTVSLSLFAGPERILRRFSVFTEEPRKSIITAIEPCNPVFQPRPS